MYNLNRGQGADLFVATKATKFFVKSTIMLLEILNIRKLFEKYKQENEYITENTQIMLKKTKQTLWLYCSYRNAKS